MLEHLDQQGVTYRLELVLVDGGVTAAAARTLGRDHDIEVLGSGGTTSSPLFGPSDTPGASRSPTAASDAPNRLAKSFENTTTSATGWLQVACIATTLRHLSRARAERVSGPSRRELLTARPQPREVAEVKGAGLTMCKVPDMGDHIYNELADSYAASAASGPPNALYDRPTILRLLGPVRGRRVLELGCAAGHLTRELVRAGAEVIALDKSERMVEHARRLVDGRARVEVADLSHTLPMVDSESMDLVSASLVLHYLPDWQGVISEVHRVLKPGGALVMSVHHPITGWFRSDRSDYHRIELIEERWNVDGIETTAQMWRRPVSAVFSPLLHQGLVIDAVYEPEPRFDERAVPDDRMREALNASPVFLYVRATRPL